MDYEKIIRTAFSKAKPLTPPDRAEQLIRERGSTMKKNTQKSISKGLSILVAVAVILTAGITVVATDFSFADAFNALFNSKAEHFNAPKSGIDFSAMGKELDISYENEDYSIKVNGIIADRYSAYIQYDILLSEKYDEFCKSENVTVHPFTAQTFDGEQFSGTSSSYSEKNGRCISFVHYLYFDNNENISGKELAMRFDNIFLSNDEEEMYLASDDKFTFSTEIDFPVFEDVKTVRPNIDIDTGAGIINLAEIRISPLTISYFFDYQNKPDVFSPLSNLVSEAYYTLSDGTTHNICNSSLSCYNDSDGIGSANFEHPLNINDISNVTIAGNKIDLFMSNECSNNSFSYENIGKKLNEMIYSGNGYEIRLDSVIAEKNSFYLLYDLILNEELTKRYAEMEFYPSVFSSCNDESANITDNGMVGKNGNVVTLYHYSRFDSLDNLQNKNLTIDFNNISPSGVMERIDINQSADIAINFPIANQIHTYTIGHRFEAGVPVSLDSVDIASFALTLNFTCDYDVDIAELVPRECTLILDDISTVMAKGGNTHWNDDGTLSIELVLTRPVSPDNIHSISINSNHFSLTS